MSATTMQDIARRADVAPGTVANHFGSLDALAAEVITRILGDLQMPTPDVFDGVDGLADRINLLVHELAAFFERSEPVVASLTARAWRRVVDRCRTALLPGVSTRSSVPPSVPSPMTRMRLPWSRPCSGRG